MSEIVGHLGQRGPEGLETTDGQLVERLVERREEQAFDALLRRHGSMVWGVCRRITQHPQDAEDAFQATFLILVRKAGTIMPREMVGNWLHGVAVHAAQKARSSRYRREAKERQAAALRTVETAFDPDGEIKQVLDRALRGLPEKYRTPIILCDLEGKTREEAARALGWPAGSVAGRLARGRHLLAQRLTRLGFSATASVLAVAWSDAAGLSSVLVAATRQQAVSSLAGSLSTAALSPRVAFIMKGVMSAMLLSKFKGPLTALLIVLFAGVGIGGLMKALQGQELPKSLTLTTTANNGISVQPLDKTELMLKELENLKGTWDIISLEVEGDKMAEANFAGSSIELSGNTFKMKSAGANYQGTFEVDATKSPKTLELHFTEGPEKGKTNLGIYELDGDQWRICLSMKEGVRPNAYKTMPGSQHALETLRRRHNDEGKQEQIKKKEMTILEGRWEMESGERDGQAMPKEMVQAMKREANDGETTVTLGGQRFMRAKYTIDPSQKPKAIDYLLTDGPQLGKSQLGIYEIVDQDTVKFCFTSPGGDRPKEFKTKAGSNQTLSVWKRVKGQ